MMEYLKNICSSAMTPQVCGGCCAGPRMRPGINKRLRPSGTRPDKKHDWPKSADQVLRRRMMKTCRLSNVPRVTSNKAGGALRRRYVIHAFLSKAAGAT